MLVTFEGVEGCGKSTQIEKLKEALLSLNIDLITLREPGGTELSEDIRHILLNKNIDISPLSELLLFEASRSELVTKVILPSLKANKVVLIDRFIDSTVAYQGYGRKISLSIINRINNIVTRGLKINRTYLLDAPIEFFENRNNLKNKDRIERENLEFHKRIRKGFLEIAKKHPERILIIDAKKGINEIHKIILQDFLEHYESSKTKG